MKEGSLLNSSKAEPQIVLRNILTLRVCLWILQGLPLRKFHLNLGIRICLIQYSRTSVQGLRVHPDVLDGRMPHARACVLRDDQLFALFGFGSGRLRDVPRWAFRNSILNSVGLQGAFSERLLFVLWKLALAFQAALKMDQDLVAQAVIMKRHL